MKAIRFDRYGPPEVLQLRDVDMPVVGDKDVLVRVRAASVNPLDWHFMRGSPYLVRMLAGLSRPRVGAARLGADMAGSVEAVGKSVTEFRLDDEVFGGLDDRGTLAEYLSIREDAAILPKPAGVTFEQAAAVVFFLAHQTKEDLAVLRELLETGKITPVIDRAYPLSDAAAAISYLEQGHARGKIVITM